MPVQETKEKCACCTVMIMMLPVPFPSFFLFPSYDPCPRRCPKMRCLKRRRNAKSRCTTSVSRSKKIRKMSKKSKT
ncbi:hypothetical protein VTJ04DRAFT_7532 [Mycothermus thermophilus]|uniref:uncharacterized protein n=1 Tax=Humicola insolens TaxID=85995 RepID=UPI0037435088